LAPYFINDLLIPRTRDENLLLVHPHAQRTGGKSIRKNVFVRVFGQDRVYSTVFKPDAKRWRRLTEADLAGYSAYSDLYNYVDLRLPRPVLAIGVLRDPVRRAASIYHFVRGNEGHRHQALAQNTNLEDFYRRASSRDPSYFRNLQCRRICGHADARIALVTIQRQYIGVGFTDQMNDFVEALRDVFGWPEIKLRVRTPAPYDAEITPAFRRMVLADNAEDSELFETLSNGPPYRCAPRPLSRQIRGWATRARDFTLTVVRRVV